MKFKIIFKLDKKKLLLLGIVEILAVVAHNLFSALFGIEEALFFILAVLVIPLYLLIAGVYSFWLTLLDVKDRKKAARLAGIFIITAYGVLVSEVTESNFIVMIADIISGLSVFGIAVLISPFFKMKYKRLAQVYLYLKTTEGLLMVLGGLVFLFGFKDLRSDIYEGVHLWTFVVSAFIFYYLLYITKLVPRFISVWGFLGNLSLLLTSLLSLFGIAYPSILDGLLLLIITNEIFLAYWLIAKGLKV